MTLAMGLRDRPIVETETIWGGCSARQRFDIAVVPSAHRFAADVDRRYTDSTQQILSALHDDYRIDWADIAAVAGVSRQAVDKWLKGMAKPSGDKWRRLIQLTVICERLATASKDIDRWLIQPVAGSNPPLARLDFAKVGRFDLLVKMLLHDLDAAKAALEAFPQRPRPAYVTVVERDEDGAFVIDLPALGVFGHGPTLQAAEASLVDVVKDVIAEGVDGMPAAALLHANRDNDAALVRLLFGR